MALQLWCKQGNHDAAQLLQGLRTRKIEKNKMRWEGVWRKQGHHGAVQLQRGLRTWKTGKNRKSGEWFWSNGSMQHDTDHNQASRLFLRFSNEAESFPGPWDSWSEIIGEQLKPPALIKSIFPSHAWPWKQVLAKFHSSPATTRSWQLHNSLMKMRAGPAMDACYQEWASFTDPSLWDSLEPKSAQRLKLTWLKTKSFGNIWNKQQDSKSRF